MLRYLRERIAEEHQYTVDVYTSIGYCAQRAEVVEADEIGLLTLSEGCYRLFPWAHIDHLVVNDGCKEDNDPR